MKCCGKDNKKIVDANKNREKKKKFSLRFYHENYEQENWLNKKK